MRPAADFVAVRDLLDQGFNDCQIAKRTGIPRSTVRDWRRHGQPGQPCASPDVCAACGGVHRLAQLPREQYAYLLGLYLGDGHISRHARDVYKLRLFLDRRYAEIIDAARHAMSCVMPGRRVGRLDLGRPDGGHVELYLYSKQWPCLFPQHGVGKKHERRIALTGWQQKIVAENHEALLGGLIDSDGCRFIARQRQHGRLYEWTRYSFSNLSSDIRRIFCESCDSLGIDWTQSDHRTIQIARRRSVMRLESFVGEKE